MPRRVCVGGDVLRTHASVSSTQTTNMKIFAFLSLILATASGARAAEEKPYPLKTCVVSGEKLGSMGEPYVFKHDGTEVRLCCEHCRPKFDKDPAKYLEKIPAKAD